MNKTEAKRRMKKTGKILTALLALFALNVSAHPHAFISMKIKLLVQDNHLTGFSTKWLLDEPSSATILYDLKISEKDPKAKQKLIDEIMGNVVSEHYFSYLYDKQGNKIKYSAKPLNYGLKAIGSHVMYYFDFMLSKPQLLKDNRFVLETYDPSYYVAMTYDHQMQVDFSAISADCQGEMLDPNVDDKTREYAASLDKSQREADFSLGAQFAQKVILQCK